MGGGISVILLQSRTPNSNTMPCLTADSRREITPRLNAGRESGTNHRKMFYAAGTDKIFQYYNRPNRHSSPLPPFVFFFASRPGVEAF